MTTLNLEATAAAYLEADAEAKAAAKKAADLKAELDANLGDGDVLDVNGVTYRWSISVGRSPKYAEHLKWLYGAVTPDTQVLIDETRENFVGERITKSFKSV